MHKNSDTDRPTTDHVDVLLRQWQQERPDLDCWPMAVLGRVGRMAALAGREIDDELKRQGLAAGEFDVLATLRRNAVPLTPTALYQSSMLSSGAMTARLDRLERQGWIRRLPSPTDRRSLLVELTAEGKALTDRALQAHVDNERRLLAPLSQEQQQLLADLLRQWLLAHEA